MAKKGIRRATKIRYRRFLGAAVVPSFRDTALFHRTDYHEDGSKTQTYGIEMSKDSWKALKKRLELLW